MEGEPGIQLCCLFMQIQWKYFSHHFFSADPGLGLAALIRAIIVRDHHTFLNIFNSWHQLRGTSPLTKLDFLARSSSTTRAPVKKACRMRLDQIFGDALRPEPSLCILRIHRCPPRSPGPEVKPCVTGVLTYHYFLGLSLPSGWARALAPSKCIQNTWA